MSSADPIWEEIFRQQEWGKYPSEHVIRFVARCFYRAEDRSRVRLLDLGSGPGACTWYMAREGFSVTALDCSATAVERLRLRLAGDGLHAEACVGDVVQLPFPDGVFDGVVDNFCLYSVPLTASQRAVDEVWRVLRPGGRFFSASFTDRTHGYGLGREVEPGAFTEIPEGPLAGRGLSVFRGRSDLDRLYRRFAPLAVERASWTLDGMRQLVEAWLVTCAKAGSEQE